MESVIARLQQEISARTSDVMHHWQPGFEPAFADTRGTQRSTPSISPMSVTAPGDAQFIYLDQTGKRVFSRDGVLHVDGGVVKNREGKAVLGYADESRATSELTIDAHDEGLGRITNLHVENDGAVCYERPLIDPQTMQRRSERVVVGTLALARFPAGTALQPSAGGQRAPFGIEPYVGRAGDGNFQMLRVGRSDAGRLDLNRALDRMHDLYMQLEAVTAASGARSATDKTAMDLVK